ncbi:heavy-metal-associated domain-containing protein [Sinorhizobium terangae]|uniref:Copper chaperone n=1 Tax=Sinorhizobium terangae TaxID=110322 RepID=A0A6N7LFA6_SINTE|nr:heavy-metal-associated domain-containing protein [Sinorhizobium terangae]MBB4186281.1 copper chaperone [Sinorhizobium terangae]MQX15889.1 copper chaperone [Sinorhizobium terangae]WFU51079.1 heavy-metal-associated domain-containing protein [Sinorhizobium terangae]
MQRYKIDEMSCGHCVGTIEKAIRAIDPVAKVEANLGTKEVRVETTADSDVIVEALKTAGYDSLPL